MHEAGACHKEAQTLELRLRANQPWDRMKEEPHIKIHGVVLSVAKLCQCDASFSRKEG
jgi:hypothetical protein